jgi:N-acetyl sugar amidotransferase
MKVKYCRKCVLSNLRPSSVAEFRHQPGQEKRGLTIDENGICDACRYAEWKDTKIDWKKREGDLLQLLDKHRRKDGCYDVLIPGSGGRDSVKTSHLLKYKYGMHPLTVTWPPHLYTDIGLRNFHKWIDVGGFDNITYHPNGRVHRLLTKLAFENLLHPFQSFILGQKNLAPKMALKFGIKLVFYGENEAEYGNPISDNLGATRDISIYSVDRKEVLDLYISGVPVRTLISQHGLTLNDLAVYLPPDREDLLKSEIENHFLGYYLKWTPQESYYYSVEHVGFEANPERSEGTFTKYVSLDDKIDGFHYWTAFIKFGLGRASTDVAKEIRNHHLTREEGVTLVHKFDGEFPKKYFNEILEYMAIDRERFFKIVDRFRPPYLWERINGEWKLLHQVS